VVVEVGQADSREADDSLAAQRPINKAEELHI
jgi:hypothetical protein